MNMIMLLQEDFVDTSRVRLAGRRLKHISEVHRAGVGDTLHVGLINGLMGTGAIQSISVDHIEMDVALTEEPPAPLPLTLILALPRPKMLRRVIFSAASMGVKKMYLINSYRVDKSYWQSPFLSEDNVRYQLVLGLEQARDTVTPEVFLRPKFKPFVEDELPGIVKEATALVAHPVAIESCPRDVGGHVVLAIGPEGGFIPYEIDKLVTCGFSPVTIGTRILRVETAVPYLIAKLY